MNMWFIYRMCLACIESCVVRVHDGSWACSIYKFLLTHQSGFRLLTGVIHDSGLVCVSSLMPRCLFVKYR